MAPKCVRCKESANSFGNIIDDYCFLCKEHSRCEHTSDGKKHKQCKKAAAYICLIVGNTLFYSMRCKRHMSNEVSRGCITHLSPKRLKSCDVTSLLLHPCKCAGTTDAGNQCSCNATCLGLNRTPVCGTHYNHGDYAGAGPIKVSPRPANLITNVEDYKRIFAYSEPICDAECYDIPVDFVQKVYTSEEARADLAKFMFKMKPSSEKQLLEVSTDSCPSSPVITPSCSSSLVSTPSCPSSPVIAPSSEITPSCSSSLEITSSEVTPSCPSSPAITPSSEITPSCPSSPVITPSSEIILSCPSSPVITPSCPSSPVITPSSEIILSCSSSPLITPLSSSSPQCEMMEITPPSSPKITSLMKDEIMEITPSSSPQLSFEIMRKAIPFLHLGEVHKSFRDENIPTKHTLEVCDFNHLFKKHNPLRSTCR